MEICPIGPGDHAEFVALLEAGMRPEPAPTRVADDFPLAVAADNRDGLWGIRDETGWIAGLASLTREFATSVGPLPVATIGSVVTRPDRRGRGLSARLQDHALARFAARGVPLAVLWTDQPEIYAGRGFVPAGWEYHLVIDDLPVADLWPPGGELHVLSGAAAGELAALYRQHPLRTLRRPRDDARLYGMPGTALRGLRRDGRLVAYACCGKGVDFPGYVAEWGGDTLAALALLARIGAGSLATRALVPCGREDLLEAAVACGAGFALAPSGLWAVIDADALTDAAGPVAAGRERDAAAWLGEPRADGAVSEGRIEIAVWGLDSV